MRYSLNVLERFSEVYGPECIQIIGFPSWQHAKVFHSIFPHFLQSVPEAFQLACMKRCSHKHPPNYLNFNLNGLP